MKSSLCLSILTGRTVMHILRLVLLLVAILIGAEGENKPRIIDFDYTHTIEQIYKLNLLSNSLLQQLKDPSRLKTLDSNQIRYKPLSKSGEIKGGALHLLDYSPKTVQAATYALEPLPWQPGEALM
jgi:hypothetical protein